MLPCVYVNLSVTLPHYCAVMALSCAEETAPRVAYRGAVFVVGNRSVIVKSPEEYRALAKECLREAETVPEDLLLSHIVSARIWLELADKLAQSRFEIEVKDPPSIGVARPSARGYSRALPILRPPDGAHAPARLMHSTALHWVIFIGVSGALTAWLLGP
jgi:hypothetical protein